MWRDEAYEIGAGIGLGLLVGVLLGLSVADVVGSVIGGLAALFAGFLGLAPSSSSAGSALSNSGRIAGFGFACTIGVIGAVEARTHNWLGETIQAEVDQWRAVGATQEDARAYVAYRQLGIIPEGRTLRSPPKTSVQSGVLFADHDSNECSSLAGDRFANVQHRAAAMANTGGRWAKFAAIASEMPPDKLDTWLDSGYQLVCGE